MASKPKAVDAHIQRRLEEERWERRLVEQRARARRRRRRSGKAEQQSQRTTRGSTPKQPGRIRIDAHVSLDLDKGRDEVCQLVERVRSAARAGQRVLLNLAHVRSIRSSALVYLLAQVHMLRMEMGADFVTGTYPKSARVERQLAESGFYDILGVKSGRTFDQAKRATRYIRFKSDQKINGAEIASVRQELLRDDLSMPPSVARKIFRALTEAMTNVNHHGYVTKVFKSTRASQHVKGRWWLFASLNTRLNTFRLVFYDAGVGIPKTLPRKYPLEMIRQVLSLLPGLRPDDAQMIQAAMELGRTRTDLDNRGKGLMDLTKLIDTVGAGNMAILSRHGHYSYSSAGTALANRDSFVEGTLIEWTLPIDKALNALPQDLRESVVDN